MKSFRRTSQCNASFVEMFETCTKQLRVFWTNHTSISQTVQPVQSEFLFNRKTCNSRFKHKFCTPHKPTSCIGRRWQWIVLHPETQRMHFQTSQSYCHKRQHKHKPTLPLNIKSKKKHGTMPNHLRQEIRINTSSLALTSAANENSLDSSSSY